MGLKLPPPPVDGTGPPPIGLKLPPPPVDGTGPPPMGLKFPPPPVDGTGPPPMAQIAWAERLEAGEVAAFAAVRFRSPIAPANTSRTRATTVRHLDILPSGRETNPAEV